MGFIAIYCPRTGREVSTGVESDREAFQNLRPVVTRMKCAACGSEHVWSKATARLVELPAAAAPAHKSKPALPPTPSRSRPAATPLPAAPPPAQPAGTAAKRSSRTFSIASRLLDRG